MYILINQKRSCTSETPTKAYATLRYLNFIGYRIFKNFDKGSRMNVYFIDAQTDLSTDSDLMSHLITCANS
jgi:hypothetical protein